MTSRMYELRSRGSIHKTSPKMQLHDSGTTEHPARPASEVDTPAISSQALAQEQLGRAARPASAVAGQRTVPQDDYISEDEEPPPPVMQSEPSFRDGSPRSFTSARGRRTPPPSPRRTPPPSPRRAPPPSPRRTPPPSPRRAPPPSPRRAHKPTTQSVDSANCSPLSPPVPWLEQNCLYVLAGVVVVLALFCAGCWWSGSDLPPKVGFAGQPPSNAGLERWRQAVDTLSSRFPYQRRRLWTVLRATVSRMLLESRQPAVVLLLASEAERDDVQCLMRAAAAAVLNATQSSARPIRVDGTALGALDEEEAKGRLNSELDRLRGGHGVAVFLVEELQQLQPLTAMLLHGFCDNDNAPRKEALFLLSVVTSRTPPSDRDVERAVEHALRRAWGHVLSEEIFDALLARIAGNVAAIHDEGGSLICHTPGAL
ncbi:uncharacterized protein LOC122393070 [Amphibalanus amphitrite]|uniref:uncharacterized protein LOC122393070 n=1 Tax=Amphibalanus amphitrite TaxID=1232801 RepID=UPI001C901CF0|nr:uncharacterized protein LOC122393070 [Amphibalanus amphitrite]